jgi:hypothetical protein
MQIIVFTKETGKLVLHSGPYILTSNHIIELEGITSVKYNAGFYEASAGDEVKLRVPINKTNVVYK